MAFRPGHPAADALTVTELRFFGEDWVASYRRQVVVKRGACHVSDPYVKPYLLLLYLTY